MSERVLELKVRNHAGVMSHVTGLFSRRAFNIEGILCGPIGNGKESRIFLLVNVNGRLPQLVKQLEKLYDVSQVLHRPDIDCNIFRELETLVTN